MKAGWMQMIIGVAITVVMLGTTAFAQDGGFRHESDISQATQIVMPSVVAIETRFKEPTLSSAYVYWQYFRGARPLYGLWGTGFIYKDPKYVITSSFLMSQAEYVRVILNDGRSYSAEVLEGSGPLGVAVLEVEWGPDMVPVSPPYGNSDELRLGQPVGAIGKALNSTDTFATSGVISAIRKETPGSDEPTDEFLQFDASYQLSFIGGPLIDSDGRVVGMVRNTAGVNLNLGVPVNDIVAIADRLIAGETAETWHGLAEHIKVSHGLIITDQAPAEFDPDGDGEYEDIYGRWMSYIEEGSPAEIAGVKAGDILFEIDGMPIQFEHDWVSTVRSWKIGNLVILRFLRFNEFTNEWEIKVTQMQIAAQPED